MSSVWERGFKSNVPEPDEEPEDPRQDDEPLDNNDAHGIDTHRDLEAYRCWDRDDFIDPDSPPEEEPF